MDDIPVWTPPSGILGPHLMDRPPHKGFPAAPPGERRTPVGWYVLAEGPLERLPLTSIVLAHPDKDYRIAVTVDPEEDEVHTAIPLYPCARCRWAGTCEDGCHT